jgi:hypothetical protein
MFLLTMASSDGDSEEVLGTLPPEEDLTPHHFQQFVKFSILYHP